MSCTCTCHRPALTNMHAINKARNDTRNRARREDIEWMLDHGETLTRAATRMGLTRGALTKWCIRNAPDLLDRLRANEEKP